MDTDVYISRLEAQIMDSKTTWKPSLWHFLINSNVRIIIISSMSHSDDIQLKRCLFKRGSYFHCARTTNNDFIPSHISHSFCTQLHFVHFVLRKEVAKYALTRNNMKSAHRMFE
ncbi:unnamed protein product [Albugo candida]|uniref:Uncharacterized protein n=1 Tax=Albugo candida TaxID=65357 RepID=A0A024FVP7_9STRA|nr:unnamed protein product [Albugo candida]|eukprot:CCI11200.1 unnamed protein product [Albugo candida]